MAGFLMLAERLARTLAGAEARRRLKASPRSQSPAILPHHESDYQAVVTVETQALLLHAASYSYHRSWLVAALLAHVSGMTCG